MPSAAPVKAGDEFGVVRTCDPYRPIYYGAASGDFNPIHIDERFARAAGLDGAILQGMCTLTWASEACVAFFGGPERIRRLRARFSRPVLVGDTVTVRGRVIAVENGIARAGFSAVNQRGEDVLKNGQCDAVVSADGPDEFASLAPAPEPMWGEARYEVGAEKIREFALATYGAIPSLAYPHEPPADLPSPYWTGVDGTLVAPPTFAAVFSVRPFIEMMFDPALGVDRKHLVHGEQDFRFLEPIRAGDVMQTVGRLTASYAKHGLEFLVVETASRNQHGREAVRATWTAVVRK